MPLAPSTRLGSYEIVAPLGAGGMGEVYRARDTRLGREVALKVLPAGVADSADRLARFEHEARAVAALNHPNIVVLHTMEEHAGMRFLTMELVEGQGLDRHIAPGGLAVARVVELGIALADALTAAHERGIVHRDLKPANVMLTREGRVKVLDFGLAKLLVEGPTGVAAGPGDARPAEAGTTASPLSEAGRVLGTAPYMAPEQLRGEVVDARTDVFALGVLLYELAAGRRPFTGASAADITSAILRDPAPSLAAIRPDAPADLVRIVERCLEKSPRARFQTALDLSNDLRGLRRALERAGVAAPAPRAPGDTPSIAVLPFANRSADPNDEYFSDGLADELLNVLAKIRGLRVAARTSAFHFKGKDTTIAEIGRALHVASVLEGSVRKAGNRVRIAVQLVKVDDGYQLWSETYDRTLDDIFAVQDDIARCVVQELRTTLLGEAADSDASGEARADVSRAAKGRSDDPEAHRLFLLARHLIDQAVEKDSRLAIAHLEAALQRDPNFALAWAELAVAMVNLADQGWGPAAEGYTRAHFAAGRALALEPELAEGHSILGWIQVSWDWDWKAAEASYARARELAPGNVRVLRRAAMLQASLGRREEGIALLRRALEIDALNHGSYLNLAVLERSAGRYAEAEVLLRRGLEIAPRHPLGRTQLAQTLAALGRPEEALEELEKLPEGYYRRYGRATVLSLLGRYAEAEPALQELIAYHADSSAYQVAVVHALRGEADAAFAWLERAYAQRDSGCSEILVNIHFRGLESDPRWDAFLRKMKFRD